MIALTNGTVDLQISTEFGPRVLRYGFVDGPNILREVPSAPPTTTAFGEWRPRGGHRLWVAPEAMPGSYAPDDGAVDVEAHTGREARVRQATDASGIEKRLAIELDAGGSRVLLSHEIVNRTAWPIEVAPWGISIVAAGGRAIIPQPPHRSHREDFTPARALAVWKYTDVTDPRWTIGKRLIVLSSDEKRPEPQKIGVANEQGWCAYAVGDVVFIKRFDYDPSARYPDFGTNNQIYGAGSYLEVETLGPLRRLVPGEAATHVERWYLFRHVDCRDAEEGLHAMLVDLVAQTA